VETGIIDDKLKERASKYIIMTGNNMVDLANIKTLEELRKLVASGLANDISKYNLVEAYKTSLVMTINARSLQNFLSLRTDKSALWEIQDLARAMYDVLPDEHTYLFQEFVKDKK